MTRHALRTLVKADNAEALELLGYPANPQFSLTGISVSESVAIGGALRWRGTLTSKTPQSLKIALRVHFLKANGEHSVKVFAVKEVDAGIIVSKVAKVGSDSVVQLLLFFVDVEKAGAVFGRP